MLAFPTLKYFEFLNEAGREVKKKAAHMHEIIINDCAPFLPLKKNKTKQTQKKAERKNGNVIE